MCVLAWPLHTKKNQDFFKKWLTLGLRQGKIWDESQHIFVSESKEGLNQLGASDKNDTGVSLNIFPPVKSGTVIVWKWIVIIMDYNPLMEQESMNLYWEYTHMYTCIIHMHIHKWGKWGGSFLKWPIPNKYGINYRCYGRIVSSQKFMLNP